MSSLNLKEALIECLDGTLSSEDDDGRKNAEARLKALEVTDQFGLHLLEIIREPSYSRGRRQLASVLLRQYVDTHWSVVCDKFIAPEPTDQVKETIKQIAPLLLADPESKIRNSVATVISSIAHWDWPEKWPNLFDILFPLLDNKQTVKGAMRVMTELAKELTDQHVFGIAPALFTEMLRILNNNDKSTYTTSTRVHAIEIFRTLSSLIVSTTHINSKELISTTLEPVFAQYMTIFAGILQEETQGADYAVKKAIVKTTAILLRLCPKRVLPHLALILRPIWAILTTSIDGMRKLYNGEPGAEAAEDSDGDECGIESVVFSILELINILLETPSMNDVIKNGLNELIYYVIFYMQLPQERVEAWISNPVAFATDEDDDNATYTLRVCAQDMLLSASEEFPDECLAALSAGVQRHMANNVTNDWRLHEACLAAVCSLGTKIVKPTAAPTTSPPGGGAGDAQRSYFDIHGFVQTVVIPGLSSGDILLSGRCLVLGSNFCTVLDPDTTRRFVQVAAEHVAAPDRTIISRILAAKAITIFVEQAKENLTVKMALLEVLPRIIDPLITFATTQSVEILSGFLDIMVGILELDDNFTASISESVSTLVMACFVRFNGDPVICPTLEEIVSALCKNHQCVVRIQERFTPLLVSYLNNMSQDLGGAQGVALDILTTIVRSSPAPLSPILINDAFPAVIGCLQRTEDQTVLQNGGECLRAYTNSSPEQVSVWRDNLGVSGLAHVVTFAIRLLDPSSSEFSATFVGKLVTTLIVKTGDRLGDQLQLLLRAVLSKLQSADTLSVIQNLLLVYAHLFNTQMEAALSFLDGVPGPTGQSALHFVMTEWVSRQQCFFGAYDRKVSVVALCKLLEYGISTNDSRLTTIQVKGDPIIDQNQPVLTRSRRAPEQWTTIPLLVKFFKLLIHELSHTVIDGYESDSETDDAGSNDKENFIYVGDELHNNDESVFEFGLGDSDLLNDPLFTLNLETYLKQFMQTFSACPQYREMCGHINSAEAKVLSTCQLPSPTL